MRRKATLHSAISSLCKQITSGMRRHRAQRRGKNGEHAAFTAFSSPRFSILHASFCEESDRAVYTLQALVSEAEQRLAELPKLQEELQKDVAEAARSTVSLLLHM